MTHSIDKKRYDYYSKYLDKDGYLKLKELDLKDENITYNDFYYITNRAYLKK